MKTNPSSSLGARAALALLFPLLSLASGAGPSGAPSDRAPADFRSERKVVALPGGVELVLHSVPGGLWFAETETTQAQWESVMKTNPVLAYAKERDAEMESDPVLAESRAILAEARAASAEADRLLAEAGRPVEEQEEEEDDSYVARLVRPNHPVYQVSYEDALAFLVELNGLPSVRKEGFAFRLPTLDEWRMACRAGGTGPYGRLADGREGSADEMGWIPTRTENVMDLTNNVVRPVAQKKPNAWGLFDMVCNVEEWTSTSLSTKLICTAGGNYWADTGFGADGDSFGVSGKGTPFVGFRVCAVRGDDGDRTVAESVEKDLAARTEWAELKESLEDPAVSLDEKLGKSVAFSAEHPEYARDVAFSLKRNETGEDTIMDDLKGNSRRGRFGLLLFPPLELQVGGFDLAVGLGSAFHSEPCCGSGIGVFNAKGRTPLLDAYGLQVGLIENKAVLDFSGIQVAGIANVVGGDFAGVEAAVLNRVRGDAAGLQLGIQNEAGTLDGLQLGLQNEADTLHGLQLGLWNVVRGGGWGMQIGLWNTVGRRELPLVNIVF